MINSELIRYYKKRIIRYMIYPLKLLSTNKRRIMLINDMSPYYADSLKYIGNELCKRKKKFEIIYAGYNLNCYEILRKKGIKHVQLNSFKYFYYGMTSKILVTNSGGISYLPLKTDQFVMNTWHGGGAYKKIGIDMYEDTKMFRNDLRLAAKNTDIVLSTCERFKEVFSRSMLVPPNKFLSIGMPRNDALVKGDKNSRYQIRKKLGLSTVDRMVLFAPTYRKINNDYFDKSIAISYGIDEKMVCKALSEKFGGHWIFAYRYHPCITNRNNMNNKKDVIDLTDYDDMQELLLATDVLINDFSSSIWDFMLTGKPCFIFARDLQEYIRTTELYTPISDWPFMIADNNQQLADNIKNFDEKKYKEKCLEHYKMMGGCENGDATLKACDWIIGKCDDEKK